MIFIKLDLFTFLPCDLLIDILILNMNKVWTLEGYDKKNLYE